MKKIEKEDVQNEETSAPRKSEISHNMEDFELD